MEATWWNGVTLMDQPAPREGEGPIGFFRPTSPEYFPLYRIPLLEGRTFEPGDARDAAEQMVELLNDAPMRQRLAEAGRARAVSEFSIDRHADTLAAIYRSLGG